MTYYHRYFWLFLGLLLVSNVPLFLSMPLTADAVLYDLQARCLLEGGVLYRDILEPNLPGIVWCHALIRSVAGRSMAVLRVVDLLLVSIITLNLCRWVSNGSRDELEKRFLVASTCLLISWFYLGTSEWCHCQRDTWMLVPSLLGLTIFFHNLTKMRHVEFVGIRRQYLPFLAVGFLFGLAFWLKPFIAIPVLTVLLISKLYVPRWINYLQILMTIVSGGLIAGIIGVCWMISSGCWPYFLETLTQWNPEYYHSGRSRWTFERFSSHVSRFWPWILLHIPAVYLCLKHLLMEIRQSITVNGINLKQDCSTSFLQAFYLGWLFQAFAFQQLFDYIHVPGVLLSISVIQKSLSESKIFLAENMFKVQLYVVSFVIFTLMILGNSRALDTQRLQHWRTCVVNYFDVPPQVKDGLCHWPLPRWEELAQVTEYLKLQNISDGEVAAYNGSLIQIYPLLNLHAPTRYAYLDVHARCFPKHLQEISEALDQAKPKFIICNLEEDGFPPELLKKEFSLTELQTLLAGTTNCFPYNQELVFQSHNYLVYRKTHATGELASTYRPLSGLKTE